MAHIITSFERLWQSNLAMRNSWKKFAKEDFASEDAYRKFVIEKARASIRFAQTQKVLREMFIEAMPYTFTDALNIEGFQLKTYFELLKKHPELVRANREAVFNLLVSLNTQDPQRFEMEDFPLPAEFGI